jgi:hypothetical protein
MKIDLIATRKTVRSLSRLRGRAGVGVLPRVALFVWREPPPATLFERVGLRASFARLDPASGRGEASQPISLLG